MRILFALNMLLTLAAVQPGHASELASGKDVLCKPLREAFLHNIDAIIRMETVNFMLKKDDVYVDRYSGYYDDALSHFDVRTLLKAIDVISANCPLPPLPTEGS
ncbi:hypothetical protein EET67_15575 [Pseudaminobacter arsenicus]|uniref:Uncharacterized protein n=1 Tax=Borborobacter arsenicus TaxID=1851146 RepID=A0A432V479_9HYPH|nr:hypothetical protein [Pseudaminobacter arsenicus]RUM96955.1 hypothetical protein EET67_15575 [Pseudaminobacter arsenicus]